MKIPLPEYRKFPGKQEIQMTTTKETNVKQLTAVEPSSR